jgi:hypothetical protein
MIHAQRPNKALQPTAGPRTASLFFMKIRPLQFHARSRQRWLSSVSLGLWHKLDASDAVAVFDERPASRANGRFRRITH